jgi:hypothetical protein
MIPDGEHGSGLEWPSISMSGPTTPTAYAAHFARHWSVFSVDGSPWELRDRILRPLALPHDRRKVDRESVRRVMRRTRAVLAEWSEGWDTEPSDWWYICCDDADYDLSHLRRGPRYETRQGLKNCEIKVLDPSWCAQNGYAVYQAAYRHYGTPTPLQEDEFVRQFTVHAQYPGRETWGAFVGTRLVAWESCVVVGDAVMSASAKSDPAFFKAHPNNALVYTFTKHYLRERGLRYVTSGARPLLHRTNAQEFKERMGYRKIYSRLCTQLSWIGSLVARTRPHDLARRLGLGERLGDRAEQLDAFVAAVEISRRCGGKEIAR